MKNKEGIERTERIIMTDWKLLTEWYCVFADVTEDEMADFIYDGFGRGGSVDATTDQIKQRLYGGFDCLEGGGVHVLHTSGEYTYLGKNSDVEQGKRDENWKEFLSTNADQPFDRQAIFASDAPEMTAAEKIVGDLIDGLMDENGETR